MGRIAALLVPRSGLTPLQRRLVAVGRVLASVAVGLCAVVLVLGLARGQPVELMLITAISLVVAAVPESLPAVVTLSLALGARRMAVRNAIVRPLPAVETLGSVTVIATDKTGTITEGRMVSRRLWTPAGEAVLTGGGYAPEGLVGPPGGPASGGLNPGVTAAVAELLTASVLSNDAALRPRRPPQAPAGPRRRMVSARRPHRRGAAHRRRNALPAAHAPGDRTAAGRRVAVR
jgi:Ca2+-transporting ATPase